jgi:hypothetical protein
MFPFPMVALTWFAAIAAGWPSTGSCAIARPARHSRPILRVNALRRLAPHALAEMQGFRLLAEDVGHETSILGRR